MSPRDDCDSTRRHTAESERSATGARHVLPTADAASQADGVESAVRAAYAERAQQTWQIAETLYTPDDLVRLPNAAVSAALGLDDPVRAARLQPGETVLDIGCGAGIDTLLAALAVGPHGQVIGLDLTDELLSLARQNAAALGLSNTRCIQGDMAALPLPGIFCVRLPDST